MQFFALNVLVISDTIYKIDEAEGKANSPNAAPKFEADIMANPPDAGERT